MIYIYADMYNIHIYVYVSTPTPIFSMLICKKVRILLFHDKNRQEYTNTVVTS